LRGAPGAGADSLIVLSKLPLRRLLLPMKPSIILDIGRRLSLGAVVLVGLLVIGTALLLAPKVVFSSLARDSSFCCLFFLPRTHKSRAAIIPMMARIAMARPALAPVDIPLLLLELDGEESDDEEVEAAPATAVLEAPLKLEVSDADVRKVDAAEVRGRDVVEATAEDDKKED
jgi:hypothetical protein